MRVDAAKAHDGDLRGCVRPRNRCLASEPRGSLVPGRARLPSLSARATSSPVTHPTAAAGVRFACGVDSDYDCFGSASLKDRQLAAKRQRIGCSGNLEPQVTLVLLGMGGADERRAG
jgi:hypothetical protein